MSPLLKQRPQWRPWVRGVAVLCLGWGLAVQVQAQNPCISQASAVNPVLHESRGMWQTVRGWLGLSPRDDSGGIGGTGVVVGRPGIGGTGIDSGGIGGTGIVGVITGFASICVNGVEVQFDAATPVSDNGMPGSAQQLAVGQVVAVQAAGAGEALAARHIALIHAVVGPLEALDAGSGEFRVLGQAARALVPADLADLKVGHWVRVSGHRLALGEIVASRIDQVAPQAQAQLKGTVSQVDADGVTVAGTRIHFSTPQLLADMTPGREVLVSGQWNGRTLLAQRVQMEPTRQDLGAVQQVVLEGYVHALDGRELNLGRGPLTLSPEVQLVGGSAAQLVPNQRVLVSGRLGEDLRVSVERVEFRNGGGSSGRGERSTSRHGADSSDDKGGLSGKRGSDSSGSDSSGSSGRSGSSGSSGGSGSSGSSGGSGGSGGSGSSGGGHK